MNGRKRQRITTTDDSDVGQINKLQRISSCLLTSINRYSVTSFEDFPNEVIYEMFEYLDASHIYQGFSNLNIRFQNLFKYLNVRIKINYSIFSKSTFQNYYTDFIRPIKHRIKTLHVSDPITIEYIFPITENIIIYSQLQTLFLDNIESEYLENLLNRLTVLSNLSSLTIHVGRGTNKINIYNLIFQLPVLKYCELSFEDNTPLGPLPISTNISSPIEHLLIKDNYDLNEVDALLSYVPQLHRLSITTRYESFKFKPILILILLKNLAKISFTMNRLPLNDIEQFIKKHYHQIKLLHLSTNYTEINYGIDISERLILPYLPQLKTFQFQDASKIFCNYTNEIYQCLLKHCGFQGWDIRQRFFTHEPMSEEYLHKIFCSFKPHIREYYTITSETTGYKHTCHVDSILHSVCTVIIQNENELFCGKSFPNVTELTLPRYYSHYSKWFASDDFHRMIPLSHLTKLSIDTKHVKLHHVLDILFHMPNIYTLICTSVKSLAKQILSLEESEIFRLVSNQNKIQNITITNHYSLKTIKLLINLFPRLQHLTIGISRPSLEPTIRFLLSENNETPCHVSSLCILGVYPIQTEKLKTIVESKKRLDDYSITTVNNKFYLWW